MQFMLACYNVSISLCKEPYFKSLFCLFKVELAFILYTSPLEIIRKEACSINVLERKKKRDLVNAINVKLFWC